MALAKKLTVKERLAQMKAAKAANSAPASKPASKTTTAKTTTPEKKKAGRPPGSGKKKETEKKAVSTGKSKGRPSGVKYVVPEDHQELIGNTFAEIETNFKELEQNLNKFVESGNKSAVKVGRLKAQNIVKLGKVLRKQLTDAKDALQTEAA